MAAAAQKLDQVFRYPFASSLVKTAQRPQLALAAAGAPVAESLYFAGSVRQPQLAANLLLATSDVALDRYYFPPGMVAAILRAADPVITAADGRLRFESFSQCCGVYARADMLPDMLVSEQFGKGTTNVDFNPPMRAALAKVRDQGSLDLSVTADKVAVATDLGDAVEHKVQLPLRWLKGFAEVQALAADLELGATLAGPAARRFLGQLPRQVKAKDRLWLVPSGSGLRLSQRPDSKAVATSGLGRLAPMKPLARFAETLRVYGSPSGISAFELEFGAARFMLILSAAPSRGFSGEGQLLQALAMPDADAALSRVKAKLAWQAGLKADELAADLKVTEQQVTTALALLAAQGLVGMDPREGSYFHRVLPFDLDSIEGLHPRLKDARKLHAEDAVSERVMQQGTTHAKIAGKDVTHRIRFNGDEFHCTCIWHSRTLGASGPCKHVLAAMIADDE